MTCYLPIMQACRWEVPGSGIASLSRVSISEATLHVCAARETPAASKGQPTGREAVPEVLRRQRKGAEQPCEVQNPETPPVTVFGPDAMPLDGEDTAAERLPQKVMSTHERQPHTLLNAQCY